MNASQSSFYSHARRRLAMSAWLAALILPIAAPPHGIAQEKPLATASRSAAKQAERDALKDALAAQINELRATLESLKLELPKDHPKVRAAVAQLRDATMLLQNLDRQEAEAERLTSAATDAAKPSGRSPFANQPDLAELQANMHRLAAQLEQREAQLAIVAQQLAALEADRSAPPIENGQWRVFNLARVPAADAAKKILALFGSRAARVSIDDRANSIIVYGKPDLVEQIGALLQQIDSSSELLDVDVEGQKPGATSDQERSVLLRIFWLADGLPKSDGQDPQKFLTDEVLNAVGQLGLDSPRLVGQTVNALASKNAPVNFTANVPALLFKQPASLSCTGQMEPVADDRARLEMQITVAGQVGGCNLSGSLVTPLGHYMVLGTANSIAGLPAPFDPMQMGGMPGGYGAEGGFRGGYGGEFGGRGEMSVEASAEGMAAAEERAPQEPKFNASRFAFVVQVIDGESYAPSESKRSAR
jgi:hypothetical protein